MKTVIESALLPFIGLVIVGFVASAAWRYLDAMLASLGLG